MNEKRGYCLQLEEYMGRFSGVDGHACMLRTLCEIAQVPKHKDGFMGDAMNAFFTPTYVLDSLNEIVNPNEYIKAQRDGRVWEDCTAYTDLCPFSLFQVTLNTVLMN